jgi:hypothetical protein
VRERRCLILQGAHETFDVAVIALNFDCDATGSIENRSAKMKLLG